MKSIKQEKEVEKEKIVSSNVDGSLAVDVRKGKPFIRKFVKHE